MGVEPGAPAQVTRSCECLPEASGSVRVTVRAGEPAVDAPLWVLSELVAR